MASLLHRLNVRNALLAALLETVPSLKIVSREEGVVDASALKSEGGTEKQFAKKLRSVAAANGFGFDVVSTDSTTETVGEDEVITTHVRFTNDLMTRQHQWGARGNTKTFRAANGITDEVSEESVPEQVLVSSGEAGEIPVDDEPGDTDTEVLANADETN